MEKLYRVMIARENHVPDEGLILPGRGPYFEKLPDNIREMLKGLPEGTYIVGEGFLAILEMSHVWEAHGRTVRPTEFVGVYDVIIGEDKDPGYIMYPTVNTHGGQTIKSREHLYPGEYTSREEAEAEAKRYVEEEEMHSVLIPYGSQVYGESRDRDLIRVVLFGRKGKEAIEGFGAATGLGGLVRWSSDDVVCIARSDDWPFLRLVVACLEQEYGAENVRQLLDGFAVWNIDLGEAIRENTRRRLEIAEQFPIDFSLRKAIFATLQRRAWEQGGDFVDCKAKALEWATPEERSVFERLLYHGASDEDIKLAYELLFEQPYCPPDKVLVLPRRFSVWKDGEMFCGDYDSSFGWSPPTPYLKGVEWENKLERWLELREEVPEGF